MPHKSYQKTHRLKKNATATVEVTEQISTCNNKTKIRNNFETPLCTFTEANFSLIAKIVFCHWYLWSGRNIS